MTACPAMVKSIHILCLGGGLGIPQSLASFSIVLSIIFNPQLLLDIVTWRPFRLSNGNHS